MIRELSVKNLALIEDLRVEFSEGFTIFTGETGAGKSILIGAIGLLLGDRASSEMVRAGKDEAEVGGVFELQHVSPGLEAILAESSIDIDENTLVVRRRIARSGRGRIHLNDSPVQLSLLKRIGDLLVDFHSQHEHQSLLKPETPYEIIDGLPSVAPVRDQFDKAYCAWCEAHERLSVHEKKAADLAQRRDFLQFQHNELSSIRLREGEEEELEARLRLLSSTAERSGCITDISSLLSGQSSSINSGLAGIRKRLTTLAKHDPSVAQWVSDLDNASRTLSELETFCGSYGSQLQSDTDPSEIERANARLARIQRLKKKYGGDISHLLSTQASLAHDLSSLENIEADREQLKASTEKALKTCTKLGKAMSKARAEACTTFDKEITHNMEALGFNDGRWRTNLHPSSSPGPNGMEEIEFTVQTNPGEPFLSLIRTASGGEISRLMLATKTVIAEHDRIPILIFDEIDSGIGGVLAKEVARALLALSRSHQVICITHLQQIASQAHHHYQVYKEQSGTRTVTRVKMLSHEEKVAELARMMGGESDISRRHARALLAETKLSGR